MAVFYCAVAAVVAVAVAVLVLVRPSDVPAPALDDVQALSRFQVQRVSPALIRYPVPKHLCLRDVGTHW